jgi:hypothetical protein
MIKLEPLKKISSERYFAAETRIKNIFYNIGFAASVVEVSLAAGRMINWTPANIGFWIYAAGGAMLTAHVFGWTTKIANYFNFKITKLDEMIALEPVKTPERSRTFAEEIAEKCDYNLASFGRRLKK